MPASRSYPVTGPLHWNGNLPVAIDLQTSGKSVKNCNIMQVAFLPLAADYSLHPKVMPFEMRLQPLRNNFDSIHTKCKKETWTASVVHGIEPSTAADLLDHWFHKIGLSEGKKLVPIGHNYTSFDKPFLIEWLGEETYNHYFDFHDRDTMMVASFINDLADMRSEPVPFAKFGLQSICNRLGIQYDVKGDAKMDAWYAAQAYRGLLLYPK